MYYGIFDTFKVNLNDKDKYSRFYKTITYILLICTITTSLLTLIIIFGGFSKNSPNFLNLSSIITISGGIILIINIILTLYIFHFRIQLPGIIICILISTIYGIASGMTMVGLCINFHPSIFWICYYLLLFCYPFSYLFQ